MKEEGDACGLRWLDEGAVCAERGQVHDRVGRCSTLNKCQRLYDSDCSQNSFEFE